MTEPKVGADEPTKQQGGRAEDALLAVANGKTANEGADAVIFDATEADFDELVVTRSHEVPVLVDIGADWCAPCRVLGPLLTRLAKAYDGKFVLANVDADENMRIAGRHQVRGFPTVIAYSRGVVVDRFHSAQSEGFLRHFIDQVVQNHAKAIAAAQ